MSAVLSIIAGLAADVGAPIVKKLVEERLGGAGGRIAGKVIDEIAAKAGVEPRELPDADPEILREAIVETEAQMPELIDLWSKGLDGQFALLQADTKEGFWQSFWRWGWMYLLALFWIWRIVVLPVVNWRITRVDHGLPIEAIEFGVLLTLTGWFISLYMGGHTLKAIGGQIADAVMGWRTGK